MSPDNKQLCDWIESKTGQKISSRDFQSVSGGCINRALRIGDPPMFVKINSAENLDLFEAESKGLELLAATNAIRVPKPIAHGIVDHHAVFVLEWIDLFNWQDRDHQEALGRDLALLHQYASPSGTFGLDFENHIGRTPQKNTPSKNWAEFFAENRIGFQCHLASKNGWEISERDALLKKIHDFLSDRDILPNLLHGDLWSGNYAFDTSGHPVIYDPAVYYGDPEADIAFTHMFGGFSSSFYSAYRENIPTLSNENLLHRIYNLYHELNHFNLFGGGYRQQSQQTITNILSQL